MIKAIFAAAGIGAIVLLVGCDARSSSPPVMASDMLGCQHAETYARIVEMIGDNDPKAGTSFINSATATGECREIKSGTVVFPLGDKTVNGVVIERVRPKGQSLEYWTLAKAVNF